MYIAKRVIQNVKLEPHPLGFRAKAIDFIIFICPGQKKLQLLELELMNKNELFKCFEQETLIQIIQESPVWYLEKDAILFEEGGEEQNSMYIILSGQVFIKNPQPGENDLELNGVGLGVRLNIPPLGTNYPAVSFSLAYGFPAFGGPDPSDGSSRTLYLNGMVSF